MYQQEVCKMNVEIYHSILWSKYKAEVFSEMHRLSSDYNASIKFFQIAESDIDRMSLSGVELRRHRYPYTLIFKGAYSNVPATKLFFTLFWSVYRTDSQLVLLPGFSEFTHWGMLFAALLSGKKRAVFCDSTLRDRPQSLLKGILKGLFFRLCNGYFTYGERGKEYLIHYGANPSTVFQRVQAAALPEGYSPENARQGRMKSAHSPNSPLFLYVGRLSTEKSIDVLLHAFKTVLEELPSAKLRVVGSGPQKEELVRLSEQFGLFDKVKFVGSLDLDALAREYASATCFVLPSRSEPWGLVVNEALHFGCPVIVSDACGCVPELVVEGATGFSFRVGDAKDLSTRMIQAASVFSDIAKTTENCLRIIAYYSPEKSARQTLEACTSLVRSHP